jgi:hypothetical protein
VPGPGVVMERSYIPSQSYEIAKNSEKTGGFTHVLAYKSPKTPFFALKYLTRYTHETFFEEYTNFEGHYLSRCRDIPLQSFGSNIRPQPHGLGLRILQGSATLYNREYPEGFLLNNQLSFFGLNHITIFTITTIGDCYLICQRTFLH